MFVPYRTGAAGGSTKPGQANSTTAFAGVRGGGGGERVSEPVLDLGSFQYRSAGDKSQRDCQYDLKY
jgi:hypothetical protein